MKNNYLSILFAVVVMTVSVFSGTPQTQQGAKSLHFGLNGLSELSVNNSYFGGKYLIMDKLALFAQLNLKFKTDKPDNKGDEYKTNRIGLQIGLLYYLLQKGPISLYIGPGIGFSNSSSETSGTYEAIRTIKNNLYYGGLGIGVEWWIFDEVSLSADTFLGVASYKTTEKDGIIDTESTATDIGIIGSKKTNFTISFYF